jgi:hypothetical protein
MPETEIPKTVICGDHKRAPYSFVCIHLQDGHNPNWEPLPVGDGREVEHDWVCPECLAEAQHGNWDAAKLTIMCIHCVRHFQKLSGFDPASIADDDKSG